MASSAILSSRDIWLIMAPFSRIGVLLLLISIGIFGFSKLSIPDEVTDTPLAEDLAVAVVATSLACCSC